jgi:P27 family predicted phage terminase small subunit
MRGRRPDTAAVKTAKGNPGRRPIVPEGVAPGLSDDVLSSAPDWLSATGREVWNRIAPDLVQMRLLSRPDVPTFGRYCEWFAHWLTANAALNAGSLVVTTTSEHVEMDRLNKNLQAALLIEKRLVDIEDRFGLNPANRQRIFAQRAAGGANAGTASLPFDKPSEAAAMPSPPSRESPIGLLN